MKRLFLTLVPILLLLALVAVLVQHAEALPKFRNSWITMGLPYAVLATAGVLAWRFNKSMLAMLCLYLGVLHLGMTRVYHIGACAENFRILVSLATPGFFAWFYLGRERGVLNEHGVLRLLFMLFLVMLLAVVAQFFQTLPARVVPGWLLAPASSRFLPLPRLAAAMHLFCWGLLVHPSTRRDPKYGALLGAVLATVFVAFCLASPDLFAWNGLPGSGNRIIASLSAASLAFTAAGIVTLYAVLEISHGTAFTDQLTQLPGRRALDYRLAALGRVYAIAMVDIDHFKKVNDTYGHDVGDQALRFIASKLKHVSGGRTFRYGGEEFAIVFPRKTVDQAEPILNAIREDICRASFFLRDTDRPVSKIRGSRQRNRASREKKKLTFSVSIGVADSVGDISGPDDVVRDADKALYKAKTKGRNRVVVTRRSKLDVSRVLRAG